MLNNLLAILPGDGGTVAGQTQSPQNFYFDNFGEAALYALIGFIVVFIGIVLIIFIIWLLGLLLRKTNNLEFITKLGRKKSAQDKKEILPTPSVAEGQQGNDEIPDEVKAAIVAAVTAYYQESEEKCQFTVKRIKRI